MHQDFDDDGVRQYPSGHLAIEISGRDPPVGAAGIKAMWCGKAPGEVCTNSERCNPRNQQQPSASLRDGDLARRGAVQARAGC